MKKYKFKHMSIDMSIEISALSKDIAWIILSGMIKNPTEFNYCFNKLK